MSILELNKRIDYSRRYVLALISPVTVLLIGISFYYFAIRPLPEDDAPGMVYGIDSLGLLDGLYYAVITMTARGQHPSTFRPNAPCAHAPRACPIKMTSP